MPPAPKIAILGASCINRVRISEISVSRPWKIFGSDGSIEIEFELGNYIFRHFQEEGKEVLIPVVRAGKGSAYLRKSCFKF
jgi:predicted dehydrogenase